MAEKIALVESYLSCHVCTETFRDPVTLGCSHSFCSNCLQQFWGQTKNKNCPICKRKSSKDPPVVNFTLKELAESFVGKLKFGPSETQKEEKEEEEELVCRKHKEEAKLFCKDEQRALCSFCDFPHHQSHNVVPIGQAVSELKDQLESDLESLQDKKKKYKEAKETYNEMFQHSKKQLLSTERQIRAQFNQLQQLLREEEESRLAALREEEKQKGKAMAREMKMIEEKLSSLSDSICAVEEELQKHNVSFLSTYKATQSRTRSQCSLSDPQLLSGALIDVAKHLGNLSFRVWDKMKDNITFTPVILDPNTANGWLYLSDDLTSVTDGDPHQQRLPDNPERNTKYSTVLGSEGFSSGKHSWEVEVGDHPDWTVGLAKESADRKGKIFYSPKSGFWCLHHRSGKYTGGLGETVRVKKSLQRIRVQLYYDRGEVSFYDPEDTTHIYTHRDTFTEKMFPYFNVGEAADAKSKELKICQTEIKMAEKIALVESYLTCHVCKETLRDPVTLGCSHSFCSNCLQQFWGQTKNKNCPICKRKSSKENLGVNFTLKELAESFVGELTLGKKIKKADEEKEEEEELVCRKHKEKPELFCKDEQRALCSVCDFPHHQSHNVVPTGQAVSELKDQLESDLESLQDKKKKYKEAKETYNEMFQHSKKQLLSTEKQIRAQFNQLQQLLKEEEESRLAALREEEEQKGKAMAREMKMIEEKLSSLSDSICAVEEELQKHNMSFLSTYKATQSRTRSQCSLSDPQLLSGALIDVAKHLGNLSFRVWDKMKDNITFTPVILDPNTANGWLYLSDDLTSVRDGDTHQQRLPHNPERNTNYTTVLGSEGFSSGKHSWEVEVGDHPVWTVGLAKESADRKGERDASPKSGFWCLHHRSGKYIDGLGGTVRVEKSLQRIRVQLDYDRGEVSFYDPEDTTHIYTHRDTFTEKLFPYFNVGEAADAKSKELKICQTEISL
ncbi:uncharacterized protein LOC143001465 [Genypterus blacodes]|uniref:uncharacterized protein LOC143001465 n=1 Tax=Genypterus blacodes TaxID=154954 RepID=UPI003F76B321